MYLVDGNIFQSPDEMANFHFAYEFAVNGDLAIENAISDHTYIHPRSVNVNQAGEYVPVGFIGMPVIYGGLAKVFGLWSINILPALVGILGAFAFFILLRKLFDKRTAMISFICFCLCRLGGITHQEGSCRISLSCLLF